MDLTLTEEQHELAQAARRLLGQHGGEWWPRAVAAGWSGLAVSEAHGGSAAARSDLAVLFEELGRAVVDGPVLDRLVLGPELLELLWIDAATTLRGVVDGTVGIAVHLDEPCTVEPSGVRGRVGFARSLDGVTHHLVVTPDAWALVDAADCRVVPAAGFLPDAVTIEISGPAVAAGALDAASRADIDAAVQRALPLLCAYQVGSCQAVHEMSVGYAGERVQFGKPIGTFQRVQDHLIDIVNATDSARWATNFAVWRSDGAGDHRERAIAAHLAKAVTAEAHVAACVSSHEVHAGIGVDLQYPLARHTHASRALYARFGDPRAHRRQIARLLGLAR
jgi:alkylation response protein AidB-like acyl-CoA dehydrogenase